MSKIIVINKDKQSFFLCQNNKRYWPVIFIHDTSSSTPKCKSILYNFNDLWESVILAVHFLFIYKDIKKVW